MTQWSTHPMPPLLGDGTPVTVHMPDGTVLSGVVVATGMPGEAPGTAHAWRVDIVGDEEWATEVLAAGRTVAEEVAALRERVDRLEKRPFLAIGGTE